MHLLSNLAIINILPILSNLPPHSLAYFFLLQHFNANPKHPVISPTDNLVHLLVLRLSTCLHWLIFCFCTVLHLVPQLWCLSTRRVFKKISSLKAQLFLQTDVIKTPILVPSAALRFIALRGPTEGQTLFLELKQGMPFLGSWLGL